MSILGLDCDMAPRPVTGLLSRGLPSPLTNPNGEVQLGGAALCQVVESEVESDEDMDASPHAMPPDTRLAAEVLRQKLGVSFAPTVMAGLVATVDFFQIALHESPFRWIDYLRGIDFHSTVSALLLEAPKRLVRHRWSGPVRATPAKPFYYLADSGASPTRTGTTFDKVEFERYEVTSPVFALRSIASSLSFAPRKTDQDDWDLDRISRVGGAVQYIVSASAFSTLRRVP